MKHVNKGDRLTISTRREFLRQVVTVGAWSFFGVKGIPKIVGANPLVYPPRARIPNPYVSDEGKPLLVTVLGTDIRQMLRAGFERLGGLHKLINDNQDVLIKPNLNGVDIYPAISSAEAIAALAQEVAERTTGTVRVGDTGFHSRDDVYAHIDLEGALTGTGAEAAYFTDTYNVRRSSWSDSKPDYLVYTDVYDAPIIINFACMKRHYLAHMSMALKNNVGAVAGSDATESRAYLHGLSGNSFLEEVAEVAGLINPELTVVDARSVLVGNGPFSDMPDAQILHGLNFLIISGDMMAVDLYCSVLLQGYDRDFSSSQIMPTLNRAHELGLGVRELSDVEFAETYTCVENLEDGTMPLQFELHQNHPNPFNSSTQICFRIHDKNSVALYIYDALGRKISTVMNREMAPGQYSVEFHGNSVPSGLYFYQLRVGPHLLTKKMTLLR